MEGLACHVMELDIDERLACRAVARIAGSGIVVLAVALAVPGLSLVRKILGINPNNFVVAVVIQKLHE